MHYTKFKKRDFLFKLDEITAYSIRKEEIRNAVSGYGYDQSRLNEGRSMWEGLKLLHVEAHEKSTVKRESYARKKKLQAEIHKKYMKYLKLARIAFLNDIEAEEALLLIGARARTYEKWVIQVSVFVNNMTSNDDYLNKMRGYGVLKDDLKELRADMDRLGELSDKCVRITAVVRMLNNKVKKETIEVQHWVSNYLKVARIALEDNPDVLALLGIGDKN